MDIYLRLVNEKDTDVHFDFSELQWIDGNMTAYLGAIVYKLNKENNLQFYVTGKGYESRLDVLFRNGFISDGNTERADDDKKTVVPLKMFTTDQVDEFCNYVRDKLMRHRGMSALEKELKDQITDDLIELIGNIEYHSHSDRFFLCGQYYPQQKFLVFTITDLGVGFLPAIQIQTKGEIATDIQAIRWAISGNTTKKECGGGRALKRILQYCQDRGGILQIASGTGFYASNLENTIWNGEMDFKQKFAGATINLYFRTG